ncbi:MAG: hypothetical protein QNJ70_27180 [Xenococcaceae cyanobacterium MO_207.B15]|nr:hypothetical protein [Xenococcaceae cyanobacterium MO_207.B15]
MSNNTYSLPIKKNLVINFCFETSFWAFLVLNAPTIKLLYFSPAVNAIAIVGLYLSYFLKTPKIMISKTRIKCLAIMSFFWAILLLYGIFGTLAVVDTKLFIRYISVYIAVVGLIFFITERDLPKIVFWQIIWGTGLSIYQIFYGVSYANYDNHIHYNIVATPLASSLLAILGLLFLTKNITDKILIKVVLWLCMMFNLIALAGLWGRRHLLFSLLIFSIFILLKYNYLVLFKSKNFLNFLKIAVSFTVIVLIGIYNLQSRLSDAGLQRYYSLFYETETESRYYLLYQPAIEAITNNPFGYGLNASETIVGYAPHNIVLEILISGGIFGFIPFLIFVVLFFKKVKVAITHSSYQTAFAMISLYLFLSLNVGLDLASSYAGLGSMAITICTTKNQNYKMSKAYKYVPHKD